MPVESLGTHGIDQSVVVCEVVPVAAIVPVFVGWRIYHMPALTVEAPVLLLTPPVQGPLNEDIRYEV